MRSRVVSVLAAVAVVGSGAAVVATGSGAGDADERAEVQSSVRASKQRHEPGEWMLTQRLGSGVPKGAYQRALAQADKLPVVSAAGNGERAVGGGWKTEGPTNIGGRLVDVALDPDNRRTVFVAAASGGVWKSTNAGRTFEASWPRRTTQAIGAMAMGSDGTLWVGTGETNPGGGSTTFAGNGLWRSTDDGASWQSAGLRNASRIGRIMVDPTDPDRIFVAVSGNLFRPGGTRGLYRTEDGGQTWQKVLSGATPTAAAVDIAIDPTDTDNVYSTFWDHQRTPEVRRYGGPGSRAYKSTDGGDSWTRMREGLPPARKSTGRMGIAVAPSQPDRLYLTHVDRLGAFAGFFRSNDAGETWNRQPDHPLLVQSQSSYGWWFGRVWVTPDNANDVWVAGVPLMRSPDGGTTWAFGAGPRVHVDQHAMVWDDRVDGRIYLGNDGGLYRTDNDGVTWRKAKVEPYTQFYTVDIGEKHPAKIVGGTQDNGCNRSYRSPGWNTYACGDGLETLINPEQERYVYSCSQYGFCERSEDGGNTNVSFYEETTSDRRNWKSPIEFDPNDPSVMYYAGNILNRSTDRGVTWEAISPDLTSGPSADPQYPYGTITTVAPAATDPQRLYVGTDDSRVWVSENGGGSWQRVDDELPRRWVTRVRVDPTDEDVVYATLSGFRRGEFAAHVFRSRNGGQTWRDISSNLPNAPVNDIVLSGRQLYVANDVGVFISRNGGQSWSRLGLRLPRTPVMELRVHEPSGRLFAGTFGRGIYSTRMP